MRRSIIVDEAGRGGRRSRLRSRTIDDDPDRGGRLRNLDWLKLKVGRLAAGNFHVLVVALGPALLAKVTLLEKGTLNSKRCRVWVGRKRVRGDYDRALAFRFL